MTGFQEKFGFTARVDLDRTFRFGETLLQATSSFIQANEAQLKKTLRPADSTSPSRIRISTDESQGLDGIFATIEEDRANRESISILILGRYNHSEPAEWQDAIEPYGMLDAQFMTVHRAKGLEADYVILVDVKSGRFGFPSEVASDPLMNMVVPSDQSFDYAEERRVFYVALTRARRQLFVLADVKRPSTFIEELRTGPYQDLVEWEGIEQLTQAACPSCEGNKLVLAKPKRVNGYAWRCTSAPYCDGRAKTCPTCKRAPIVKVQGVERCSWSDCGPGRGHSAV